MSAHQPVLRRGVWRHELEALAQARAVDAYPTEAERPPALSLPVPPRKGVIRPLAGAQSLDGVELRALCHLGLSNRWIGVLA